MSVPTRSDLGVTALDQITLTPIVRSVLNDHTADVVHWQTSPIIQGKASPAGVYRILVQIRLVLIKLPPGVTVGKPPHHSRPIIRGRDGQNRVGLRSDAPGRARLPATQIAFLFESDQTADSSSSPFSMGRNIPAATP